MAKLVSGRVEKISSANVSADRYEFLSLQEAEPDLGVPSESGQVLASNTDGSRFFVTLNTDIVTEGNNLYYTNSRVAAYLSEADIPLSVGDLVVSGNLTVQGETTTLNTAILVVEDKNIILANGAADANAADGAGITIDGAQANLIYDSGNDRFDINRGIKISKSVGGYITFAADAFIGEEPDGNIFRIGAPLGYGVILETDRDIEGNNWAWDFAVDGNFTIPKDLNATSGNIETTYIKASEHLAYIEKVEDTIVELSNTSSTIQLLVGTAANVTVKLPSSNVCLPGQKFVIYNDGINSVQVIFSDLSNSKVVPAFWSATYIAHQGEGVDHWNEYVSSSSITGSGAAVGSQNAVMIAPTMSNPVMVGSIDSTSTSFALLNDSAINTVNAFGVANIINIGVSTGVTTFAGTVNVSNDLNVTGNIIGNVEGIVSSIANHSINALFDVDITNVENDHVLIYDANTNTFLTTALLKSTATDVANIVLTLDNFTTSNIIEGANLYFTNARVDARIATTSIDALIDVDISGISTNDFLKWDGDKFIATAVSASEASNIANVVLSISNFDTDDLQEGTTNLYYTNARVISAFTPGQGITISSTGIISAKDESVDFNLSIDGGIETRSSSSLYPVLDFSGLAENKRILVRSILVTNISDSLAYLSGNILYEDGNSVVFANAMPIPDGTSLELLKKEQVFSPGDILYLQSLDSNYLGVNNLLDYNISYETVVDDTSYSSKGVTMNNAEQEYTLHSVPETFAIIESIRIINLEDTVSKANIYTAYANDIVSSYLAYNVSIPAFASLELLQRPKRLNTGTKLKCSHTTESNVSVLISYREGDRIYPVIEPTTLTSGSEFSVTFSTTIEDGTTIFYSYEE